MINMKKVKVIDKSVKRKVFGKKEKQRDPFYHLIAETPEGKKIAFGVDQGGK